MVNIIYLSPLGCMLVLVTPDLKTLASSVADTRGLLWEDFTGLCAPLEAPFLQIMDQDDNALKSLIHLAYSVLTMLYKERGWTQSVSVAVLVLSSSCNCSASRFFGTIRRWISRSLLEKHFVC